MVMIRYVYTLLMCHLLMNYEKKFHIITEMDRVACREAVRFPFSELDDMRLMNKTVITHLEYCCKYVIRRGMLLLQSQSGILSNFVVI